MTESENNLLSQFRISGKLTFHEEASGSKTLLVTGDFYPSGKPEKILLSKTPDRIFSPEVHSLISASDITIVNLECPITKMPSSQIIQKRGPALKADPLCAKHMALLGINAVSLANNHIKDYGDQGLLDTLEYCSNSGIKTFGAGENISKARESLVFDADGITISVLAGAESEFSIAGEYSPGASPINAYHDLRRIQNIKKRSDIIIFILHGGNEFYNYPNPWVRDYCRFLVDAGADAVVCHHSHVISGFELHENAPIVYSTGNFLFDWPEKRQRGWYFGYLVKFSLSNNGLSSMELIPYSQCLDCIQVKLLEGEEKFSQLKKIVTISEDILDDRILLEKWSLFRNKKRVSYLSNVLQLTQWEIKLFSKAGVLLPFRWKQKRILKLLNIVQCESHRNLLLDILKEEVSLKVQD